MELVKWPLNKNTLQLNSIFDNFFNEPFYSVSPRNSNLPKSWTPKVDIYDTKDAFVIKVELPGIEKKDIKVDVDGKLLTLKGERTLTNSDDKNVSRREIFYGSFERTFTLPDAVNADKIKADHKNGLLTLEVPKPEESKPKQITIH